MGLSVYSTINKDPSANAVNIQFYSCALQVLDRYLLIFHVFFELFDQWIPVRRNKNYFNAGRRRNELRQSLNTRQHTEHNVSRSEDIPAE
jgi:hypothetical protein